MTNALLIKGVLRQFREAHFRVAFAESCTGGLLCARFTEYPGSSDVVAGSAVCYQTPTKGIVLGIAGVDDSNVVSEATAKRMALQTRRLFSSECGISTTGYLDGTHNGEGPHAYYAIASEGEVLQCYKVSFDPSASRNDNRETLIAEIVEKLWNLVSNDEWPD